MNTNYRMFSKSREIFPQPPDYQSSRMICGHLNRIKMKPNPSVYLDCRKKNICGVRALAIASRCLCASKVDTTQSKKIQEIRVQM